MRPPPRFSEHLYAPVPAYFVAMPVVAASAHVIGALASAHGLDYARQVARAAVLDLNRTVAGWLGLDPTLTLCSNFALAVSRRTDISFAAAKRVIHGGIAGVAAAVIAAFGAPFVAAFGLGYLAYH